MYQYTIISHCYYTALCTVAGVRLPASHRNMYGYFVDMDTGNFVPWDALIPTTQSLIEKGAVITIGQCVCEVSVFVIKVRRLEI